MKKLMIFNIIAVLMLTACYDRDQVVMGDITPPVLSSNLENASFEVTEENQELAFETFRWTPAGFGFDHRNPDYVLRMDLEGNDFQNSVSLGTTKALEHTVMTSRINQNLLAMGVAPSQQVNVQFKVLAGIHADLQTQSNVIAIGISPMEVVLEYPKLYLAGDHNGWAFTDMIWSMKSNDVYEGYIWMDNGDNWNKFKMSFQPNWDSADAVIGDPDPSGTSGTLQVGDWGGHDIQANQGTGYYKIIANLDNLTYQLFTTEWAVTGDFNSWSFTPMVFDVESNTWSLTADLTAGGFKFIANEDWSLIYGDDDQDGILDPGHDNNNILITEDGNYTITLDLHQVPYSYSVTMN